MYIKAENIKVKQGFMFIQIPWSKTNHLQKGSEVVISKTGWKLCPVSILEKYIAQADIVQSDARFIFQLITESVRGERPRESVCLTYVFQALGMFQV